MMNSNRLSIVDNNIRVTPALFKTKLTQSSNDTLDRLKVIWEEAGYEEAECQSLLGEVLNKLESLLSTEIAAEERILEIAKEQIVAKLNEYNELCSQLGRQGKIESDLGTNYATKFSTIEELLEVIGVEISQREELLNTEYSKIKEICLCLGEDITPLELYEAPVGQPSLSDARLDLLRSVYSKYLTQKKERIDYMKKLATKSFDLIRDLEIVREGWHSLSENDGFDDCNNILMKFFQTGDWTMGYHINDVATLKSRLDTLQKQKESRKEELTATGAEIARLWTLLRIPTAEREAFNASFKLNLSMETLNRGRQELDRLLTVRKTSLKRVVTSIRNDIATLWNEAGIESQQQRKIELPIYYDDLDTLEDSSVELHESYYTKLKARVDELRPILAKIARRETIIQERVELEHIQLNPDRLTARGPNAVKDRKREEEMANRVKNVLEKLTKDLLSQIASWEEQHGPFLFAGEKYADRVNKQEENYIEIRDTLRNSRKKKDISKVETIPIKNSIQRKPITSYQSSSFTAPSSSPRKGELQTPIELVALDLAAVTIQDENYSRNRESNDSAATDYTSATEVRDRASSATVVRTGFM